MSILRPTMDQPSGQFTQFPRAWRRDPRITGLPRDVLLALWDNAGGWLAHNSQLIAELGISEYSLGKALKTLRSAGYLTDPDPDTRFVGHFQVHHVIADPFAGAPESVGGGGIETRPSPPLETRPPNDTNNNTNNDTAPALRADAPQAQGPAGPKKSPRRFGAKDPARAAARAAAKEVNAATGANLHGVTTIIAAAVADYGITPVQAAEHLIDLGTHDQPVTKAALALRLDPDAASAEVEFARFEAIARLKDARPTSAVAIAALEELTYHRRFTPTVEDVDDWAEELSLVRAVSAQEAVDAVRAAAQVPGPVRPRAVHEMVRALREQARVEEARRSAREAAGPAPDYSAHLAEWDLEDDLSWVPAEA